MSKRLMGLATAALCIALVEPSGMEAAVANSHPPVRERFETLVMAATAPEEAPAWVYASSLLIFLLRREKRLPASISFSSPKDLCAQLAALL